MRPVAAVRPVGLAGWLCLLMRSMRSCRSLTVNFQLNGRAVWLYRSMKATKVRDSCPRLSKSLGVTTFFCVTEKKNSIKGATHLRELVSC